ncbi:MAG: response regulator, partial [Deltaproteobacteria bacterium]|nr:response regulator [Deltaproteobacteria bacterium]
SSGYTDDVIEQKGKMKAGAVFLSKPATKQMLLSKVREALDQAL